MEPPLSPTWLHVCVSSSRAAKSILIVTQIEQAIGKRPQFTGDALSMRQQYKAFADQANSSCTKSANLSVGK
jgi:hypothetical protein